MLLRPFVVLLLVTSVSGCTLFRPKTPVVASGSCPSLLERQRDINSLDGWQARGKVGSGKILAFSGRVNWVQDQDDFVIDASGPFGAGATRISGSPQQVSIDSGDEFVSSYEPEVLLQQRTGISVPLENIDSWVLGLPGPSTRASYDLDGCNRIVTLQQDGWVLEYSDYADFAGYELPARTVMTDGRVTLKFVLLSWEPNKSNWPVNQIQTDASTAEGGGSYQTLDRGSLFDRRAVLTADREEAPVGCPIPGM